MPWTDALLASLRAGDEAIVPLHWSAEVANTLLVPTCGDADLLIQKGLSARWRWRGWRALAQSKGLVTRASAEP